jgi:hypothetical protein
MYQQHTSAGPSANAVRDPHRIVTNEISIFAYLNSEVESVCQLRAMAPKLHVTGTITTRFDRRRMALGNPVGTNVKVKTVFGCGWVTGKSA